MSRITAYCHLNENTCRVNGKILAERDAISADGWFKQLYKDQEFAYPKFHKMDVLSQAGFLSSELIKRVSPELDKFYADDEIALLFANRLSSSDTDVRFKKSYQKNGSPSPALFVYTLPNIVLGEIAILNKWYGENMFAVLPKFTPEFFVNYGNILLSTGSRAVLCGWLDISGDKVNVFMFLIEEKSEAGVEFNIDNLAACADFGACFPDEESKR